MRTIFMMCVLSLMGCADGGNGVTVSGKNMPEYFPFDGSERSWTFESDAEAAHRMVGVMDPETTPDPDGNGEIVTVDYDLVCIDENDPSCVGGDVRVLEISSNAGNGVRIHAVTPADGTRIEFDPPALIGDRNATFEESWVTETSVGTFTSTFMGSEPCSIRWVEDWNDCVVLEIDDSGVAGLTGTIWAVASWNMVAFRLVDDLDRWELSTASWTAD